jgi:hypothetical protein
MKQGDILMDSLGQIVVIQSKCVFCGRKVETDTAFDLVFCSVDCWSKFKELSQQINKDFGYAND